MGFLTDRTGSFTAGLFAMFGFLVVASVLALLLRRLAPGSTHVNYDTPRHRGMRKTLVTPLASQVAEWVSQIRTRISRAMSLTPQNSASST